MSLKNNLYWKVIKETCKKFLDDNPFRHSAAIAFYTIFSLPGIAILSVTLASYFYEQTAVKDQLITQITMLTGQSGAEQVEQVMDKALLSGESLVMKIVGFVALLISATTVFISLQDSLNTVWKIKPKPAKAFLKLLMKRLLSLAMIASIGFLILVSLMAETLLAILKSAIEGHFSGLSYYLITAINISVSVVLITFIFGLIYKVLPDADIKWRHVTLGAFITTVLFVGGKYLIGFYLSTNDMSTTYGAAGSLVALLSWVYFSVLILMFGAQFTYVYNKLKGRTIMPSDKAVSFEISEVEVSDKPTTNVES